MGDERRDRSRRHARSRSRGRHDRSRSRSRSPAHHHRASRRSHGDDHKHKKSKRKHHRRSRSASSSSSGSSGRSRSRSRSNDRQRHRERSHKKDRHSSSRKELKKKSKSDDRKRRRRSFSASRSRSPSKQARRTTEEVAKGEGVAPSTKQPHEHSDRRKRSRSRGREPPTQSSSAPPSGKPKFAFSGMALKISDKKTLGLKNKSPTAKAPKLVSEAEKKKRREKLKLWREQQLKQVEEEKEKLVKEFLEPPDAVPKQLQLWSAEHEEEESKTNEEDEAKKKREEEQRQREQQVVDEVDPLDAYMAGLVDEAAIQQSIANPAANVISLEEIEGKNNKVNIYGTFLPPMDESQATAKSEKADAPAPQEATKEKTNVSKAPKEETPEEREAREERELQEFMRAIREKREQEEKAAAVNGTAGASETSTTTDAEAVKKDDTGRIYQGFEEDVIGEEADNVDHRSALEILQEAQKKKEIKPVDHSQIDYLPFQKKFYVVPKEIKQLTDVQVEEIRKECEIKIRGKNCPRPVQKWTQCGFSLRLLQLIQKHGYTEPFAIQRQALPAIMSGRDVIGIAKTGSGKTLAFLLPMFRHILHQPPLKEGEGPIGMIMAPARELAQQIYVEAKKFAKDLGMRATAVYGGSSVSEQIANLKRGSDIVICTPGRMIDILCMSAGKMVSLKRVTYVVLDEADRMFDMGFEPQITKIMMNIREDRQTLLFSATFPRAVEALARKVLKKPVEITVGARSTASGDITQYVEVREENDKFMRLLQLLGVWYEKGNVLVFVNTQQACDQLFQDLMKAGYPALSLHGGKDQVDRDFTVDDFKRKVRTLMVATSVAGRGLDVKDLVLVINYHCPNHLEDYVHRVGRTGRAGRKGTAYTFISPDEEAYAVDLVKALESAKQTVPPELTVMADAFKDKVKRGLARYHGSGFAGSGYTFDASEKSEAQKAADLQKRQYELDQGIVVEDNENDDGEDEQMSVENETEEKEADDASDKAPAVTSNVVETRAVPEVRDAMSAMKKAQQIAQILDMQYKQTQAAAALNGEGHFIEELEINDYPQQARWKVTQKEATESVAELTGAAVIARGSYVPSGRKPNPGERKLYLAIEGPTRHAVLEAKRELQRILDETTLQVGLGNDKYSKYNV